MTAFAVAADRVGREPRRYNVPKPARAILKPCPLSSCRHRMPLGSLEQVNPFTDVAVP